jgi:hypothetical protein
VDANQKQVRSWFDDEELRPCPQCGERLLIPAESERPYAVCIECGPVELTGAGADAVTPVDSPSVPVI